MRGHGRGDEFQQRGQDQRHDGRFGASGEQQHRQQCRDAHLGEAGDREISAQRVAPRELDRSDDGRGLQGDRGSLGHKQRDRTPGGDTRGTAGNVGPNTGGQRPRQQREEEHPTEGNGLRQDRQPMHNDGQISEEIDQ